MQNINWEKISVYLVAIGVIYMFWQSQVALKDQQADVRERVARLEVKVDVISQMQKMQD